MNQPLAVLFDLDGTLVDSAPDLTDALNRALAPFGVAASDAQVRSWVGGGAPLLVQRAIEVLLPGTEVSAADLLASYLEAYGAVNGERATAYPGVVDVLDELVAMHLPAAIVTNKPARFVPPLLQRLSLTGRFATIVGGDTTPERKPHPAPLRHACSALGVAPERVVLVGDSKNDAGAAHAARVPFVWITHGYHQGVTADALAPVAVIDHLRELTGLWRNC